ncbi:MAG TPA: RidA family protein [Terrimesophilobacter sp.]|jgi:enamine deaminase RidA (YjgF/YER057c/UK114 family)|nr:RidA family protein [Terrimesophilobacter sp.]
MHNYLQTPAGLHDRNVGSGSLYSHVVVAKPGDIVFVSGQLSRNAAGDVVGGGDMAAQIEQVVTNLQLALAAAGATLDDVAKTTTYTTDIDLYFQHVGTRMKFFTKGLPTSTTIQVARLSNPQFLVEIDAVAVIGG